MYSIRRRVVCLADLDCFFVEVERLHRPELCGRPVIIGGEPDKRGVVASCSYEARRIGIQSAMPMAQAYRLASGKPNVVFLHKGLHGRYSLYSERVQDILSSAVPVFNAKGIDEFELDITGCERLFQWDYGGILPFAEYLRQRVRDEVGLPLSIGIGPNRIVAKIASRHAKPDGTYRVLPEDVADFLEPHDIEAVPGIGKATAEALRDRGINRVGQLLSLPQRMIRHSFGIGLLSLVRAIEGSYMDKWLVDHSPESEQEQLPKSIGHETTFERDTLDFREIKGTLWRLTEDACRRLRAADLQTTHVTVKVRYSDFKTITKGGFLAEATDMDKAIFVRVQSLFHQANIRCLRIRLLGVRLDRLTVGASQLRLFANRREWQEREFLASVDHIRDRFGRDSVLVGPGTARLKEQQALATHSTAGISFNLATPISS